MIIAVDFDGTIVEHRYPEIGREKPFAFDTLKMLQKEGHRLIFVDCKRGQAAGRGRGFLPTAWSGILCGQYKLSGGTGGASARSRGS